MAKAANLSSKGGEGIGVLYHVALSVAAFIGAVVMLCCCDANKMVPTDRSRNMTH